MLDLALTSVVAGMVFARGRLPQWRGPIRDARAAGFRSRATWPAELKEKWKVAVGDGVATPALVGDKLYVFTRQEGYEVLRCLNAADGKELWQDKYEAQGATGPSQGFSGPRSSPAVADGKVVTYGVRGTLSCTDAATGKNLWRKEDSTAKPPASSPPARVDCRWPLHSSRSGDEDGGAIAAYSLATETSFAMGRRRLGLCLARGHEGGDPKTLVTLTARRLLAWGSRTASCSGNCPFVRQGPRYNAAPRLSREPPSSSVAPVAARAPTPSPGWRLLRRKGTVGQSRHGCAIRHARLKDQLLYGITQNGDLFCSMPGTARRSGPPSWAVAALVRGGRRVRAVALTPQGEMVVFDPQERNSRNWPATSGTDTYAYPIPASGGITTRTKTRWPCWLRPVSAPSPMGRVFHQAPLKQPAEGQSRLRTARLSEPSKGPAPMAFLTIAERAASSMAERLSLAGRC